MLRLLVVLVALAWDAFLLVAVSLPRRIVRRLLNIEERVDFLSLGQTVRGHGYPCEEMQVATRDGYRLTLFRIPHGRHEQARPANAPPRPIVFLQHGLLDCAYTYLVGGPDRALAYLLADRGFDVWLGNNRGTRYSMAHDYLSPAGQDFWRFSWDEFASFDLPDSIEAVLTRTGTSRLTYVGHSQGTAQMFASLCLPNGDGARLAARLHGFVALGPVVTVGHLTNRLFRALAFLRVDAVLLPAARLLGLSGDVFADPSPQTRTLMGLLCAVCPSLFDTVVQMICGPHRGSFDRSLAAQVAEHEPGGTSLQNAAKWAQAVRSGRFERFDFGREGNLSRYAVERPPAYDLAHIARVPVLFVYGGADDLADPRDARALMDKLCSAGVPVEPVFKPTYNHLDFVWDRNASVELYPQVFDFVKRVAGGKVAKASGGNKGGGLARSWTEVESALDTSLD